jgi:Bifunctional DNA primase/polymerase, N-terminal
MSTLSYAERCAAGAACLQAALQFSSWGMAPLCCCDPDHVAVGKPHAKGCTTWGKTPMRPWKRWQTQVPALADVERQWRDYPLGNVGIVLGQGSGVVRIDVDGTTGPALLAQWSGGDLPDTWEFLSPSGGHGWLYSWDKEVPCRTTTTKTIKGKHEELRLMGNGSQTMVPPSRHADGGTYTWVPGHSPTSCALAPAPDWLVTRLRETPHAPQARWEGPRPNRAIINVTCVRN